MKVRTSQERGLHGKTKRESIALDCDLSYIALPVQTEDDAGHPRVTLEQWPFILPHLFVPLASMYVFKFFFTMCSYASFRLLPVFCWFLLSMLEGAVHRRQWVPQLFGGFRRAQNLLGKDLVGLSQPSFGWLF